MNRVSTIGARLATLAILGLTVLGTQAPSVAGSQVTPDTSIGRCTQLSEGQICIDYYGTNSVDGYFYNNKGAANTATVYLFTQNKVAALESNSGRVPLWGYLYTPVWHDGTGCNGGRYFARVVFASGNHGDSPVICAG